ncbi:MAG: apolipoprotein N-acyltransferase [Isosphaeraceae bacterium]|nr:apolipoprotein N-acyltransferase [Isosphaeraceae bacterium]
MPIRTRPEPETKCRPSMLAPAATAPRHPAVPALMSALLFWFAFPPADRGYLGWVALAPLFALVRSDRPRRALYAGAYAGGLTFWLLAASWTGKTTIAGWIVLALVAALSWPIFLALARLSVRRLGLPLMVAAPIIWVALEYIRAHLCTGFPWYYLAHTQYRYLPLIQVADVTGAWGLSFLLALVNAWWAELLTRPLLCPSPRGPKLARPQVIRLAVVASLLLACLGYGLFRLQTATFRPGPRLALIQTNFEQRLKHSLDPELVVQSIAALVERARPQRPDLIVWPETSYPHGFPVIDPRIDSRTLERQIKAIHPGGTIRYWRERAVRIKAGLRGWVDELGVPMVIGTVRYDFRPEGFSKYNAALLLVPGSEAVASYHKLHLVPFGEFVPGIERFPWLRQLTPYDEENLPTLAFGAAPVWFDLGSLRYATAICFEDTIPYVVRRLVQETKDRRPPDILLNISNDGWFAGSSEQEVHLAISAFRAVENRVPLARAVNTGVSALIDGNGRILQALPKVRADVLVGELPLDDRESLYAAWGDWFAQTCLAITLGLVVLGLLGDRLPRLRRPWWPADLPAAG